MLRFLILLMMVLLSGCVFQSRSQYSYVPPQSNADKACVSRCMQGKIHCQKLCKLKNPGCFARSDYDAQALFNAYKYEQKRNGLKVTKTLRQFEADNPCYDACPCVTSYNTCYTACGGHVIPS